VSFSPFVPPVSSLHGQNKPRWHLCLDTQILQQQRWPNMPGAAGQPVRVRGPICLGYGSRFGLGLFLPGKS